MSLTRCRLCKHGNPADSKFCSACGGALYLPPYLASCPHCGTVNPVKATVCSWCQGQLPGRSTGAPFPSSLADVAGFLRRRPSRVVVGTAVVAAIAVIGYLADRQSSPADAREPAAASSAASSREAPADAGAIGRDAAAGDTESARADDNAPLTGPPVPPSGTPAKPAAITRPQAVRAGKAGEQREQSRPQACTEAVAALGLCTTKPVLKKEVTDARKPGGQEPPRSQTCTEAAAALGLCTPTIQQRRE
jgi:hypothetical protein